MAITARQYRFVWKHLPILLAGVLAGYLVGSNKPVISNSLFMPTDTEYSQPPREKAALVALVRNSDLFGLRLAIRQIEDRFNKRYNYPYIFVNDVPFSEEFKRGVRDLTNAHVSFGELDGESWQIPGWIDRQRYEDVKRTASYPHGDKDSYRKMCRFQSGYLHRHPLLKNLDYYWRIEPDVEYYCDIDYDPFRFMKEKGIKYGWNIAMTEFMGTIPTLWNTTMDFIHQHPEALAAGNMAEWLADGRTGGYNGCHFWSNFEIVDLSLYRSKQYQMYFDYLDQAGGFFYERWGDAPVHSIAASMFLNASQIHYFDDIAYFHPNVLSCPSGAKTSGKCVCDSDKSFVQKGFCALKYKEVQHKILDPDSAPTIHMAQMAPAQPYVMTIPNH